MKREEGFTLIELMMVILIIAILVAVAVPVYLSLQHRADRAVAEFNIRAAEGIHTQIWFELIGRNTYPDGEECYVDSGTVPVDALFISARETKIPWASVDASGSLSMNGTSGMFASLDPVAQSEPGFSFQIRGYYKNGTLVETATDNHLVNLSGEVAVLYNTYYIGGTWYDNTDHKYLSMMVVEREGKLHILTFYQGRVVCSEDFVWDEPDEVNYPPGPPTLDSLAVNPGTLNLRSEGNFNTSFDIELDIYPGFNLGCFDMSTITCGNAHAIDIKLNENGKVIIKFDRQDLINVPAGNSVPITVQGQYTNGNNFSGTTNVKVINR